MKSSEKSDQATQYAQQIEKDSLRMVIIGAMLVVVHLLDIRPSEVEALGAKFTLSDPIILRGALAILFVHQLYATALGMRIHKAYKYHDNERQIMRSSIMRYRKSDTPITTIKRKVKEEYTAWNIFMAPYMVLFISLLFFAISLSLLDMFKFGVFCYKNIQSGAFLRSLL